MLNVTNESVTDPQPPRTPLAFREMPSLQHETKDVLKQLQANLQRLEDLSGHLEYVLTEVRGVLRR